MHDEFETASAKSETALNSVMQNLAMSCEALLKEVDRLRNRLTPVLSQVPESLNENMKNPRPSRGSSSTIMVLEEYNEKIQTAHAIIDDIRSRLEV